MQKNNITGAYEVLYKGSEDEVDRIMVLKVNRDEMLYEGSVYDMLYRLSVDDLALY